MKLKKEVTGMKKIVLSAITAFFLAGFVGGSSYAEQPQEPGGPEVYRVYKGTNAAAGSNKLTNSAFLHKVIVSSPAAVDYSTWSVLDIYNSQGDNTNKVASVQISTNEVTGLKSWTFDIYMSSGLRVNHSTGSSALSDQGGSVQVIYNRGGVQQDYRVWRSSFMAVDTSTHIINAAQTYLHKVSVLKKGAGTTKLRIYNQNTSSPSSLEIMSEIDLADAARDYVYNVMMSSGLTINVNSVGTTTSEIMFFYEPNAPRDWEYWSSTYTTGAVTTRNVMVGRGVFGGVINGDVDATGNLKIYDSNGVANDQLAEIDADTQFGKTDYDIHFSSGLTYTNTGNGMFTILYRRLR
jgi:hypothetical protein